MNKYRWWLITTLLIVFPLLFFGWIAVCAGFTVSLIGVVVPVLVLAFMVSLAVGVARICGAIFKFPEGKK